MKSMTMTFILLFIQSGKFNPGNRFLITTGAEIIAVYCNGMDFVWIKIHAILTPLD